MPARRLRLQRRLSQSPLLAYHFFRREGGDDLLKQLLDLPDDVEAIISVKLGEQIPRIHNVY